MGTERLQTDYLVVGSGAAGMAFADELVTHSDATVTILDRRHAPGGHWIDAYPFVRLHQPSAFYGVSSMLLGENRIDQDGHNQGFYELARADEICAYFNRVLEQRLLPSGRVRHFPSCEYSGENRFVSRLSGQQYEVDIARKLVDTTHLQGKIPATSPPPFELLDGVRCIPVGELIGVDEPPEEYVIIGAGKTAIDACVWLLEHGVAPQSIRWIKPREAWWLNRKFNQPAEMLGTMYAGLSLQIEAAAKATSERDFFERLEELEFFLRVDPAVTPTMFRGAIMSEGELALVRQIENVVRMGHILRIEPKRIILEQGEVPCSPRSLHVHCAAAGLAFVEPVPVFAPGRITIQPTRFGFAPFSAAVIGFVEATIGDDLDEMNRLCPAFAYPNSSRDFLRILAASTSADFARSRHPGVAAWQKRSRLNPMSRLSEHSEEPQVQEARERFRTHTVAAIENLQKLFAASAS